MNPELRNQNAEVQSIKVIFKPTPAEQIFGLSMIGLFCIFAVSLLIMVIARKR